MSRIFSGALGTILLATLAACSQAYSDGGTTTASPPMVVADPGEAPTALGPYAVEVRGPDGAVIPTFEQRGRFYVLGEAGQRYVIHVDNPTDNRVEAVITVDGLDVIDGEAGDLGKRGYVVPPHGDLDVEGFRTSTSEVATFRFSSVGDSYAGKKGKARNVGVIAVAIFEEQAAAQVIIDEPPPPPPPTYRDPYYGGAEDDDGVKDTRYRADKAGASSGSAGGRTVATRRPSGGAAEGEVSADEVGGYGVGAGAPASRPYMPDREEAPPPRQTCCEKKSSRPGLGTEFGERRYSAANWTRFVRASATPAAVAELRYNDATGLAALGILVQPAVDPDELTTRE
ncbi:MAG: hypothetical protein KC464_25385, partial [Myxococcales bacterium]|nr:hypothetical protein [Myxococcales bacterium]